MVFWNRKYYFSSQKSIFIIAFLLVFLPEVTSSTVCPADSNRFGWLCRYECFCASGKCDRFSGQCLNNPDCATGPNGLKRWGPGCTLDSNYYYDNFGGKYYQGHKDHFELNGQKYSCQRWDAQTPHRHFNSPDKFPDGNTSLAQNFCRNPDFALSGGESEPWCYNGAGQYPRLSDCQIKKTDCPTYRFTRWDSMEIYRPCIGECHCKNANERCENNEEPGTCKSGCHNDWWGKYCHQCRNGTFGSHCHMKCNCFNDVPCDSVSGQCPPPPNSESINPCAEAYAGSDCQFKLPVLNSSPRLRDRTSYTLVIEWDKFGPTTSEGSGDLLAYRIDYRSSGTETFYDDMSHTTRTNTAYLVNHNHILPSQRKDVRVSIITQQYPNLFRPGPILFGVELCGSLFIGNDTVLGKPLAGPSGIKTFAPKCDSSDIVSKCSIEITWQKLVNKTIIQCERVHKYFVQISGDQIDKTVSLNAETLKTVFINLSAYRVYKFNIRILNNAGIEGSHTTFSEKTAAGKPMRVSYVKTLSFSSFSITFEWGRPVRTNAPNVTKYQVKYVKKKQRDCASELTKTHETGFQNVDGNTQNYTFTGLHSWAVYELTVRAFTIIGAGPQHFVTGKTGPSAPTGVPTNIEAKSPSNTSVTVTWNHINCLYKNGVQRGYTIKLENLNTTSKRVLLTGWVQEKAIENLEPFSTYAVSLRFDNENFNGSLFSAPILFVTLQGVPSAPTDLFVSERSENHIKIVWSPPDKPNGIITSYQVEWYYEQTIGNQTEKLDNRVVDVHVVSERSVDPTHEYTISSVVSDETYIIKVRAVTSLGTYTGPGEWATVTAVTKEACPDAPVRDESRETTTYESITVAWNQPLIRHGILIGYKVACIHYDGSNTTPAPESETTLPSDVLSYTYSDIKPKNTYRCTVSGITASCVEGGQKLTVDLEALDKRSTSSTSTREPNIWERSVEAEDQSKTELIVIAVVVAATIVIILVIILILLIAFRKSRRQIFLPCLKKRIQRHPAIFPTRPQSFTLSTKYGSEFDADQNIDDLYGDENVLPVRVEDLYEYVRKCKEDDYKILHTQLTKLSLTIHKLPKNTTACRLGGFFVDGYNKPEAYISCIPPIRQREEIEIWLLVWINNVEKIVCLCDTMENGQPKCLEYWPSGGESMFADDIQIEAISVDNWADYNIRTFLLQKGGQSRMIKMYQYTAWPARSVPEYGTSLLSMWKKCRSITSAADSPILIHCTSHLRRSGTFIALDCLLDEALANFQVSIFSEAEALRSLRRQWFESIDHYAFLHDLLVEAVLSGDTLIWEHDVVEKLHELNRVRDDASGMTGLEMQFQELNKIIPSNRKCDESSVALSSENYYRNRYIEVVPSETSRVLLHPVENRPSSLREMMRSTTSETEADYINASFVHSTKHRNAYILTQLPLPGTVADFWRLVFEQKCSLIVSLTCVEDMTEHNGIFWPQPGCDLDYGGFSIHNNTRSDVPKNASLFEHKLTVKVSPGSSHFGTYTSSTHQRSFRVTLLHYVDWPITFLTPMQESFMALICRIQTLSKTGTNQPMGPLLIQCLNGSTQSGLAVLLLNTVEQLQLERAVNIFETAKYVREARPKTIELFEQFKFAYEFVPRWIAKYHDMLYGPNEEAPGHRTEIVYDNPYNFDTPSRVRGQFRRANETMSLESTYYRDDSRFRV